MNNMREFFIKNMLNGLQTRGSVDGAPSTSACAMVNNPLGSSISEKECREKSTKIESSARTIDTNKRLMSQLDINKNDEDVMFFGHGPNQKHKPTTVDIGYTVTQKLVTASGDYGGRMVMKKLRLLNMQGNSHKHFYQEDGNFRVEDCLISSRICADYSSSSSVAMPVSMHTNEIAEDQLIANSTCAEDVVPRSHNGVNHRNGKDNLTVAVSKRVGAKNFSKLWGITTCQQAFGAYEEDKKDRFLGKDPCHQSRAFVSQLYQRSSLDSLATASEDDMFLLDEELQAISNRAICHKDKLLRIKALNVGVHDYRLDTLKHEVYSHI